MKDQRGVIKRALNQSEALFAMIFDYGPDMITIQDAVSDVYIDANPTFLDTLGYARPEVVGCGVSELGVWAGVEEARKGLLGKLAERGRLGPLEYTLRTKSGRVVTVLSSMVLLEIDGRQCLVTISKDITELRRYEKEMARLDRLNLLGEMAGSIAHEIRNPLTTIRGFLQLMNEKDKGGENRGYYEIMIEELDRANTIISDYLGIVRNNGEARRQPGYLNSIIRALYPMILADANMRDLRVELDLGDPPRLSLDEKEIRQMILNMTRNGLDAMPAGGTLTIRTGMEKGCAVLSIKDEGSGLDPSVLDRLGTPFVTTKEGGTGLGLAVCYRIATRHNACIKVDTGPGGTMFTVRFKAGE